jgi:ATP-dependent helicase HepA
MSAFKTGQKWISNAEPELGMGQVESVEHRRLCVAFPVSGERRTYTAEQAPLTRVKFNPGDAIEFNDGTCLIVADVAESDGLFVYLDAAGVKRSETELSDDIHFSTPQDRLLTYQFDDNSWFHRGYETLNHKARIDSSGARGLYGPRVSLIPHQLYISHEVAGRFAPRVLLADEVGLGKTIEAGLILHQQVHTGRAERALIVVPSALVFQWFVEMIRRFYFQFTILDQDRCQQIEHDNSEEESSIEPFNPFHAQQLVLCSMDLFLEYPERVQQATEGNWDLLIVDEAHHLLWDEQQVSPEYQIVDLLAAASRGVLLLTATPEQLGRSGHFARLRLLDPDRFHSYAAFLQEEQDYEPIAARVNSLLSDDSEESTRAREELTELLDMKSHRDLSLEQFIEALLDQHGTGRVLFRNVRSSVGGFSNRILHSYPLECDPDYLVNDGDILLSLHPEIAYRERKYSTSEHEQSVGDDPGSWLDIDPRTRWLQELLSRLSGQKCLVICSSARTAIALEEWLRLRHGFRSSVFHESLDLISRDRSAAYFAEQDNGAQVLICSEIGSEGRNFQFAHHLALFDLPANPDLLEQRIGRLDRIGQSEDVQIHVPYLTNTPQEILYRWFHDGMNLFRKANPAALNIYEQQFEAWIEQLVECRHGKCLPESLEGFLDRTTELNTSINSMLAHGRDRLLELNSHNEKTSSALRHEINQRAGGEELAGFMDLVFESYGLDVDPLDDSIYLLKPNMGMARHHVASLETQGRYRFPELPEEGVSVTYDRATALSREEITFLTWENPMVTQAIDLITSDILGNCCISIIKHPSFKRGSLLVETLHLVESVAPGYLQLDQYLPAHVVRSLILPDGTNLADRFEYSSFQDALIPVSPVALVKIIQSQLDPLKSMLARANDEAETYLQGAVSLALTTMEIRLDSEISRLHQLAETNPNVRQEEVDYLIDIKSALATCINKATCRLDAVRVLITS